jgi:hypothetical protein
MGTLKHSIFNHLAKNTGASVGIFAVGAQLLVTGCSGADDLQANEAANEAAQPSQSEVGVSLQATTNTPPITPATCDGQIQAVSATASSTESSSYPASKAIDGDMGTRWSSAFSDPQWLKIDFGSVKSFNKVVLSWQNSYSTDYDLQVSNTGADGSWTTVYTQPAGDGGTDEVTGLNASGRYLRMYSRHRKTQYGNSLYEVKVYEDSCPCEDKVQPVSATASSVEGSNYAASKAIDGNFTSTRWSSQSSDPQWIQFDLGVSTSVRRVLLHWETAASEDYDVQISPTGANNSWTNIYSTTAGHAGTTDIQNLNAQGRYLRVYSTARTTCYGVSLYEIEVFKNTCSCTPPQQGALSIVAATASSTESSSLTANKAVDGNTGTRWSSQFSNPQWLKLELAQTATITGAVLRWETAASADYDLQVSATGAEGTWTTIYTDSNGNGGIDTISGLNGSGRFVRMYSRSRTTSWGVSLYEMQVNGFLGSAASCSNPCDNVVIDDGNVCTTDACNPTTGAVSHTPVATGTACADGNLCNGNETCNAAGTCTAGTAPVVNDGNPCTTDSCAAATGVAHTPVSAGTACADGNLCNGNETCNASGTCTGGTAPVVDDGNPCTADSCAAATGVAHTPVSAGTACDDSTVCNGHETCNGSGSCVAGSTPVSDDFNACTVDSCDAVLGVLHAPTATGSACDDSTVCNGHETCNGSGSCLAGTPLTLNDNNPCTADSCHPSSGVAHTPVPFGTSCADNDACNGAEACDGFGNCAAGTPPIVDDGNVCTDDHCEAAIGVFHTLAPDGTSCSDDTVCNGDEACFSGTCLPSAPAPELNDENPCTDDDCDPIVGAVHTPVAAGTDCEDGNACNGVGACNGAALCVSGPAPVVDDGNPCTADSCDPMTGATHTPVAAGTSCADANVCNGSETCDGAGSCSAGTAPSVDDDNVCTNDYCDPALGVLHTLAPNGTSCSDDTVCNGDEACYLGACVPSQPAPELDDENPCTEDACDPVIGAVHTPVAAGSDCEDGNVCNGTSACNDSALCVTVLGADIDDGNPCTADACDPVTGFSHTAVSAGTSCGAANACSSAATCDNAAHCVAGSVLPIDDGNPCTADACDPTTGVSHTPVAAGTTCADSNVCNGSETCNGSGSCVAGTALPIDDGNPCTADVCTPATGAVTHNPVAVGTSCADNNLCNGNETCNAAGSCITGTAPTVDDANPCTIDSCNPASGVIHTPTSSGSACGDADLCNGQEACNGAGLCVTVVPGPTISDGNPCTNDVCVPSTGVVNHPRLPTNSSCSDGNVCNGAETCSSTAVCRVVFPPGPPPVGTSCSDGNACNGSEVCVSGGICAPGTPVVTNDSNPCTTDSCNTQTGAVSHTPVSSGTSCVDGDVCNGTELCDASGTCVPGTPLPLPPDDGDPCTIEMCDPILGPITHQCNNASSSSLFASNKWQVAGDEATQEGVAPGTIVPEQAAVIRGLVRDGHGDPMHSVNVSVVNHPEYGATRTQADGSLEVMVNGGSLFTLEFTQFGYLPVHRQIEVAALADVSVADVVMIEPDPLVTTVELSQEISGFQIATGSVIVDDNGERHATLLVPNTVSAMMQLPDGSVELASTLSIRLTEYTAHGLSAVPADLATSLHSYAFEVNADEAVSRGASLEFSEALPFYVDNFFGFPVGAIVPLSHYDSSALSWSAEDSGVVIEILSIDGGIAAIDGDGNGAADSAAQLSELGITEAELATLADLYTPGQTLWRTQLSQLSSFASTWN